MEIFISTLPYAPFSVRNRLVGAVIQKWGETHGVTIRVTLHSPAERFKFAEQASVEDIYCLADDDCLPCPHINFPEIGWLFEKNTDFATIAMMNLLQPTKGPGLIESHAVGGIRFIRKGAVTEFPPDFNGDDMTYYELVRAEGYRQGYITEYPMLHLGIWNSTWSPSKNTKPSV